MIALADHVGLKQTQTATAKTLSWWVQKSKCSGRLHNAYAQLFFAARVELGCCSQKTKLIYKCWVLNYSTDSAVIYLQAGGKLCCAVILSSYVHDINKHSR